MLYRYFKVLNIFLISCLVFDLKLPHQGKIFEVTKSGKTKDSLTKNFTYVNKNEYIRKIIKEIKISG